MCVGGVYTIVSYQDPRGGSGDMPIVKLCKLADIFQVAVKPFTSHLYGYYEDADPCSSSPSLVEPRIEDALEMR